MVMLALADIIFICFCYVFAPVKFSNFVVGASNEFNVDKNLIYSVISVESGFRPSVVSPHGAVGLMQIMPQTAEWIALELGEDDYNLRDPKTNIYFGTFYLSHLIKKYSNTATALACYNAGEGTARAWFTETEMGYMVNEKAISYPETANYIKKVRQKLQFYRFSSL